jgi:hypothetical protein
MSEKGGGEREDGRMGMRVHVGHKPHSRGSIDQAGRRHPMRTMCRCNEDFKGNSIRVEK